jgi:hypothetical protein
MLGNAAAARVRLIMSCRDCRHLVEPDPAEQAQRCGAEMTLPRSAGAAGQCGSREIDKVVNGTERRRE